MISFVSWGRNLYQAYTSRFFRLTFLSALGVQGVEGCEREKWLPFFLPCFLSSFLPSCLRFFLFFFFSSFLHFGFIGQMASAFFLSPLFFLDAFSLL